MVRVAHVSIFQPSLAIGGGVQVTWYPCRCLSTWLSSTWRNLRPSRRDVSQTLNIHVRPAAGHSTATGSRAAAGQQWLIKHTPSEASEYVSENVDTRCSCLVRHQRKICVAEKLKSTVESPNANHFLLFFSNWTSRLRIANSRTGHLADWSTCGLDNSRTGQMADWTTPGCHRWLCVLSFRSFGRIWSVMLVWSKHLRFMFVLVYSLFFFVWFRAAD